jgi:hypothetical protein
MKNYKIVNSKEVQEKAFILGYEKLDGYVAGVLFLCLHDDGSIYGSDVYYDMGYESQTSWFDDSPFKYIQSKDFLALPEPLKVGDWVKFENKNGSVVFKIGSVNNFSCLPDNVVMSCFNTKMVGYCLEACTKLTPEQIEVLELES